MSTARHRSLGLLVIAWGFVCSVLSVFNTVAGDDAGQLPTVYRRWNTFTTQDGLPDDSVRALCVHDEELWIGTDKGLALYAGGTWRSWSEQDGSPWPAVSALDVSAKTGEVWLGTWGGGLVHFTGGRFDSYTQFNSGLAGDLVFAVLVEGDRIWVSTTGGISVLDTLSGDWELHFARRADKPEIAILDLKLDEAAAKLYATAWCGATHCYDLKKHKWTVIRTDAMGESTDAGTLRPEPLLTTMGAALGDEHFWLATRSSLLRRHSGGPWEARIIPAGAGCSHSVNCVALGAAGLWTGGLEGVYVLSDWDQDSWITYHAGEGSSVGEVILSRRGQKPERRLLRSTFPAGSVRCITLQHDEVWLGTPNGLVRGTDPGPWSSLPITSRAEPATSEGQVDVRIARRSSPRPSSVCASRPDNVTVASFGPITRTITLPGSETQERPSRSVPDSLAIQIAVEDANRIGGYRGQLPFDATYGTHGYPHYAWGLPEDDLTVFARRPVSGILASLRPEDRIATAVALRMELPVVNVAASTPRIEEEASSWIFRCRTHDPRQHRWMIEYILTELGRTRFAILRTPGLMAGEHLNLWKRYVDGAKSMGGELVVEVEYDPPSTPLDAVLDTLGLADPEVVLTWADVPLSAIIVQTMRRRGMAPLFVGSDWIVCPEFVKLVSPGAGAVIAPRPCPHRLDREAVARFVEVYTRQNSPSREERPPKAEAYQTYDAARHLMLAISIAGTGDGSIREVLTRMGQPTLATLRDDKWELHSRSSDN